MWSTGIKSPSQTALRDQLGIKVLERRLERLALFTRANRRQRRSPPMQGGVLVGRHPAGAAAAAARPPREAVHQQQQVQP